MARAFGLSVLALSLAIAAGCGGRPSEDLVSAVVGKMEAANTSLGSLREKLKDAVEKSKDSKIDVEEALKAADQLLQDAEAAKREKVEVMKRKDKLTDEEKAKNRNSSGFNRFQAAVSDLQSSAKALDEELVRAEKLDPQSAKKVRAKYNEALGVFESLAR